MPQLSMHTPMADLTLTEIDGVIVSVDWGWSPFQEPNDLLLEAKRQLDEYFDGDRKTFDLPMDADGTAHQKKVWQRMLEIPYGETMTYGDISAELKSAAQAIGNACGANPLPILIPCHRIVAASGKLGGYSGDGGPITKRALLVLEGALPVSYELDL
ncbi:methylated-DNA--protein-cysteine methyltransferase [Kordiimonas sediminis]|uniref:Methylated-DNA--protein-cysteine methyltransferase n=1 Tax=Kordiimonas sediminis TaxID=1735581 RepID=A0A919ANH1_9PROT|nr:methylated-DNA--[protein]-cysteine S-methyltransferase [Kordiimonas sediminis]GHF15553.1 methylated-DNA--protein-cysteine methyltransferase [Kordiimonas sediminis]